MRGADVRVSLRRVALARALLLLVFVGLGARAAHLSVFDEKGAARGEAQSLRTLKLAPARGHIVDRRGAELALSINAPSIYVIRDQVENTEATAQTLAAIVDTDPTALAGRLAAGGGFQFLSRWVTDEQAQRARDAALPGVGVIEEPRRVYPHRTLAAPVIGFANIDALGVRGIEQQEDNWLRGTARRLPVERDGRGRVVMLDGATWGTTGGDVALTIDATVQADAEQALRDAVTATGARGGMVVVMDPHSGELLALAEAPGFDPNTFRTLRYDDTGANALLAAGEPGSVLKPFLVAAALEADAVMPDTRFHCEDGTYRIPGKTIRDTSPHGELDLRGILQVSSNICSVKIVEQLGARAYHAVLQRFGFGERNGHFPDESRGLMRSWRDWNEVDRATMAYGQGLSVTAVQLALATSALANGGELLEPRLVWGRRAADGPWQPTQRKVLRRVVSRDTATRVVEMMESVVDPEGTASRAGLADLRVAGKTGTAQKFDTEAGRYSKERFQAWFAGVAPADAPRIVVVTTLDEPRRPYHTGGMSAAPLFARVAASQLAALGIRTEPRRAVRLAAVAPDPTPAVSAAPPEPEVIASAPEVRPESTPAAPLQVAAAEPAPSEPARPPPEVVSLGSRVLLPDLTGYSVSEVMQITASHELEVKVSGDGRATHQDPPAGSVIESGGRVRVEFTRPPRKERG